MNKRELIEALTEKTKTSKNQVEYHLNALISTIFDELEKDGNVVIKNFGKFEKIHKAERTGRNPSTGEKITIPAKDVPRFVPGKFFKELLMAK
jgi:DNA-binding protein HU-beta